MKSWQRKTLPQRCALALLVAFICSTLVHVPAKGQALKDADPAAVRAIENWLATLDQGRYLQSWVSASQQLQKSITSEDWVKSLNASRKPLGACTKRIMDAAVPQDTLPDAKGNTLQGEFVIAQFRCAFSNLFAVETVTFVKENGAWKVCGYSLKPAPQ